MASASGSSLKAARAVRLLQSPPPAAEHLTDLERALALIRSQEVELAEVEAKASSALLDRAAAARRSREAGAAHFASRQARAAEGAAAAGAAAEAAAAAMAGLGAAAAAAAAVAAASLPPELLRRCGPAALPLAGCAPPWPGPRAGAPSWRPLA